MSETTQDVPERQRPETDALEREPDQVTAAVESRRLEVAVLAGRTPDERADMLRRWASFIRVLTVRDAILREWLEGVAEAVAASEPAAAGEQESCRTCDGEGQEYVGSSVPGDEGWHPCAVCGGSGQQPTAEEIRALREECERLRGDLNVAEQEVKAFRERYRGQAHPFDADRPTPAVSEDVRDESLREWEPPPGPPSFKPRQCPNGHPLRWLTHSVATCGDGKANTGCGITQHWYESRSQRGQQLNRLTDPVALSLAWKLSRNLTILALLREKGAKDG